MQNPKTATERRRYSELPKTAVWKPALLEASLPATGYAFVSLSRRRTLLRRGGAGAGRGRVRHPALRLQRGHNFGPLSPARRGARFTRPPDLLCGEGELQWRDPEVARGCWRRFRHRVGWRTLSSPQG